MKKTVILFTILSLLLGIYFFKQQVRVMKIQKVTSQILALTQEKSHKESESIPTDLESDFNSERGVSKLKSVIVEYETDLDKVRATQFLSSSKIDTLENFQNAKELITRDYSTNKNRNQLRKRVLALHYLNMTQKWKGGRECLDLLDELSKQLLIQKTKSIQVGLKLDILAIGRVCNRLDNELFVQYFKSLPDNITRTQLNLVSES